MTVDPAVGLEENVRFLASAAAYADPQGPVHALQTHMSWLFFVGNRVLKLKKPVRFSYLDFSTLHSREFHCREELRLNSPPAPGVYLGLLALRQQSGGFALVTEERQPTPGRTFDWPVQMQRLPQEQVLQRRVAEGRVAPRDIDALSGVLASFYQAAPRVGVSASASNARSPARCGLGRS